MPPISPGDSALLTRTPSHFPCRTSPFGSCGGSFSRRPFHARRRCTLAWRQSTPRLAQSPVLVGISGVLKNPNAAASRDPQPHQAGLGWVLRVSNARGSAYRG
jgi:hypothetical protein